MTKHSDKIVFAILIGTLTCIFVLAILKIDKGKPTQKELVMAAYSRGYANGVEATTEKILGNGHRDLYYEMQQDSAVFYEFLYGKKGILKNK